MGVLDIKSNVTTIYKADASQHKAEVQGVAAEEEKLAKQREKDTTAHNKSLGDQLKSLGELRDTIISKVTPAWELVKHSAEQSRLATAAAGADIVRLQEAAGGLKSRTELLTFAAQAQRGALRLTNEEMANAQRAIRAWTREGFEAQKVTEKVTEAVVQGEAEGFKELGITLRATTTDAERHLAIKELLAEKGKEHGAAARTEAESVLAVGVKFEDAADRIKKSLGDLVISMAPLISAVGTLGEKSAGVVEMVTNGLGALVDAAKGDREGLFKRFGRDSGTISVEQMNFAGGGPGRSNFSNGFWGKDASGEKVWIDGGALDEYMRGGGSAADWVKMQGGRVEPTGAGKWSTGQDNYLEEALKRQEELEKEEKRKFGEGLTAGKPPTDDELRKLAVAQVRSILKSTMIVEGRALADADYGRDPSQRALGEIARATDEFGRVTEPDLQAMIGRNNRERLTAAWNEKLEAYRNPKDRGAGGAPAAAIRATQQSELAKVFGPIDEFNVYTRAFETLTGAAKSAFGAWIDGSMSAGKAIKRFFADSLKGAATDLLGKAIVHGVYALGSIAFYDYTGAAQHGAAAAKAAAGAAALGVLAKALHGDGPPAAGGGGGGGGAAPLHSWRDPRQDPAGGSQQIFIVGDPNAADSPRQRQLNFRRTQNLVVGTSGGTYG